MCLEAGAHIDGIQEDGSTAVHLVCSQPGERRQLSLLRNINILINYGITYFSFFTPQKIKVAKINTTQISKFDTC